MRLSLLTTLAACAGAAHGVITWTLEKADAPTDDELDAYALIEAAMTDATARYAANSTASKHLHVRYRPDLRTAEAAYNGDVSFGFNRTYMVTSVAMHEISHTLGVGSTSYFYSNCADNNWPRATLRLQGFDGPDARVHCTGRHFWPYGLNYPDEWSETNSVGHVCIVQAMIDDGM